jgi:hypothetical protein
MFIRTLPTDGAVRIEDADTLDRMYGTGQWSATYQARVSGVLEPAIAREEYVNLMRWRRQLVLRYKRTHPLEIFNERGHSIYHMIRCRSRARTRTGAVAGGVRRPRPCACR